MLASRVSRTGEYEGYSEPRYDGWARSSQYVTVRDGTRLAVDVFIPTRGGVAETVALPVAWTAKRYIRATVVDGEVLPSFLSHELHRHVALKLRSHGYVVAAADMRGTGASFGVRGECSDPMDSQDGYDVNEWLAVQPFCDGRVGMFGVSYEGRMQLNTASAAPPHLRAIVPEVSPFDWYHIVWQGGVNRFGEIGKHFPATDAKQDVAPVDADVDGSLLADALRTHTDGNDYTAMIGGLPYRDSAHAGEQPWIERSGGALVPGIARSGIATYHRVGWYANVRLEQLLWFSNLARSATGNRHRIMVGPWPAGGVNPEHYEMWATETLRFLDYWVRDIDNGIMDEPAVVYTTTHSTRERTIDDWQCAPEWPLPTAQATDFHFGAGPSNSVGSVNDGILATSGTSVGAGKDDYTVRYDIASPQGDGHPMKPELGADFTAFEEQCLTYTTPPLEGELVVTGHPVVHIFVTSSAEDGDFVVHLNDVDEAGVSNLVTRHMLRASNRAVAEPPYYFCDLPWHRGYAKDMAPIPAGEVVELAFDLLPTSYRFRAGHRIRVSISGADTGEMTAVIVDPAPVIGIWHDKQHRSRLTLPVIPT
jgi:putative CocE/NonD family hydrolase